jgi:rhodanese-related sulfurtransferase
LLERNAMTHPLYRNSAAHADGFRDVDPQVLHAHLGEIAIVDVREPHEFTGELGHIPGATLVPLATVDSAMKAWDREKDVVVVCRSGGRSARASRLLVELGFKRVMNLRGGMLAYNAALLPVVHA